MRLLHKNPHTEAVGHDGVEYERDEHGAFELPHELAESLLERFPHLWETAPDPVPAEPTKPKRGPKAKQEPVEETDPEQVEDPQVSDPADPKTEDPIEPGDGDAPTPRKTGTRKTAAAAQ